MKKVTFLANKESVHVKRWLEVVDQEFFELEILDFSLPSFLKGFKYILLGLVARFKKDLSFLHAHSALGYGLSAWVSGKDYVVTVYGTEVFGSLDSYFKRFVLRKVFENAKKISCTTPEMGGLIIHEFGVEQSKIKMFSMGVSDVFLADEKCERGPGSGEVVFFHNRRFHPHYNVEVVLEAFVAVKKRFPNVVLKLASGDADNEYMEGIKSQYRGCPGIYFLGKKNPKEMAFELRASDFTISIPKSDQLSASILESMACEAIPILAPLKAYASLEKKAECLFLKCLSIRSLEAVMAWAVELDSSTKRRMSAVNKEYIGSNEGTQAVKNKVNDLYACV